MIEKSEPKNYVIKDEDFITINGWVTRLKVYDKGILRKLTVKEIICLSKIITMSEANEGWFHPVRKYLATWVGTQDNSITSLINLFIENNIIKQVVRYYDSRTRKTKNKYELNLTKIDSLVKESNDKNRDVKNYQFITILSSYLKYNLKGYSLLIYSLIAQFSQSGQGECFASEKYMAEWCGYNPDTDDENKLDNIKRSVRNALRKLEALNLISKCENPKKTNSYIYWTTTNSGRDFDVKKDKERKNGAEKIVHQYGKNDTTVRKKSYIDAEKNEHLYISSMKDVNKVVVKNVLTATTLEKINNILKDSNLNYLLQGNFKTKLSSFVIERPELSEEKLLAYFKYIFLKYCEKKLEKKSEGLFITMFLNDYDLFAHEYEEKFIEKEKLENNIKKNSVICPVCNHIFIKQYGLGVCKECGLEEEFLNNQKEIKRGIKRYKASNEEKLKMDKEDFISIEEAFKNFSFIKKNEEKQECVI